MPLQVLCLTLTSSWRVCFEVIWMQDAALQGTDAEMLANTGAFMAYSLLVVQFIVIVKVHTHRICR